VVDYGAINAPSNAPTGGVPGRADGPTTAILEADVNVRNPGTPPIERYPFYLGDRSGALKAIFDAITVAGVIPELDVRTW
jgi:hypothetical protein